MMCGIVGFLSAPRNDAAPIIRAMTGAIAHRGPDADHVWLDPESGLAFGHRRLSIIDLSSAGDQPMHSADDRFAIVFNGEIYNHRAIRTELIASGAAQSWRGHSDTETLLAAIAHWGLAPALQRLDGMFAFALWDRRDRVLSLARDRMGEKPLYYRAAATEFVFGSEVRALSAFPGWRPKLSSTALSLYLTRAYVPEPLSIYEDVKRLPAGTFLQVRPGDTHCEPQAYWQMREVVSQPRRHRGIPELLEESDARLRQAVASRMEADVPLGAFLSGGIDSSLVVALMQAQSSRPVETFTIGFNSTGYDEALHAKKIASRLGTSHHEFYVDAAEVLNVIPRLAKVWDEPFADASQLPTLILSELARKHVKVALSGDGGDEIFGGYNRYGPGYAMYQRLAGLPGFMRGLSSSLLRSVPENAVQRLSACLPSRLRPPAIDTKLAKLASVLSVTSDRDYYDRITSVIINPSRFFSAQHMNASPQATVPEWIAGIDPREAMMFLDSLTYLPGDILTKVDRASMSVGLECRAPYLAHGLVEFSWSLPMDIKIRDGQTKWILRQILQRYLPESMFNRPKMGFTLPLGRWLAGPLRGWADALLDPSRLGAEGVFNPSEVGKLWRAYNEGATHLYPQLWTILMFQSWLESNPVYVP